MYRDSRWHTSRKISLEKSHVAVWGRVTAQRPRPWLFSPPTGVIPYLYLYLYIYIYTQGGFPKSLSNAKNKWVNLPGFSWYIMNYHDISIVYGLQTSAVHRAWQQNLLAVGSLGHRAIDSRSGWSQCVEPSQAWTIQSPKMWVTTTR